jgi:hypothetical protein
LTAKPCKVTIEGWSFQEDPPPDHADQIIHHDADERGACGFCQRGAGIVRIDASTLACLL